MAPQPKRKHSGHRGRVRAKALSVSLQTFIRCSSCGKLTRPHMVCPSCGFYNGKVVIAKKEKKEKKETEHENEK